MQQAVRSPITTSAARETGNASIFSATRRGALAALSGLAVAAATPAIAADPIETAFARWKAVHRRIAGSDWPDDDTVDPAFAELDALEDAIRRDRTPGARAAEIKLWVALDHMVVTQADTDCILREDFAGLVRCEGDYDWSVRMMVSALAAARGQRA